MWDRPFAWGPVQKGAYNCFQHPSQTPGELARRMLAKIKEVAADPYGPNNNLTKLQGRDGYRLRIGDWRVIYELHEDRLAMLVLEVGPRGGIY